jgi:signal transduction histidine kinase
MHLLPDTRQNLPRDHKAAIDPASLFEAFESFASVAGSLEQSYALLQAEVGRLRKELRLRDLDLASSHAETERTRAHLANILEKLHCGVLVLDSDFAVQYANHAARRLVCGANAEGALKTLPSTLHSILKQTSSEPAAGERVWITSGECGAALSISVSCASISQDQDFPCERVFLLRDMTEQKRLEEEREFSRRMQALAEMTALLAHEIRNPLGSLELFAGLVKQATMDNPEVSQWMVHMQAGLRGLSATVNNVLQYYMQAAPTLVRLNLVQLLRDTADFLQPLALQRGMGIVYDCPDTTILVAADPHGLQQVFFNLANNAFRAMSTGRTLTMSLTQETEKPSAGVTIRFQDQGAGISSENLSRIFDPGFTTHRNSPGLGLAVSKRVVEQHGGTLSVSSTPGQGATFTIELPVLRPQ